MAVFFWSWGYSSDNIVADLKYPLNWGRFTLTLSIATYDGNDHVIGYEVLNDCLPLGS